MPKKTFTLFFFFLFALALFLFGCQKSQSPEKKAESLAKKDSNKLTIFSWWTAGGEADGLKALIELFSKGNPSIEVVNAAVAGGAGTNAKAVLKTRMLGGDPPGTFQVHGGAELIQTWVKPKLMAPISELFTTEGWAGQFPKQLLDMVTYEENIYAVPSNVHRGNLVWYNKAIFKKHNLKLPKNYKEFIIGCKALKKAGVTPIAFASRNKWPVLHMYETFLLAAGGKQFYLDLFAGKIPWDCPQVKTALNSLTNVLWVSNEDHSALTWDQACGMVKDGKAAMTIMGDWANGYFKAQGLKPDVDYGAFPVPGTEGHFVVITDTFGLPSKAPDKKATMAFLKVVGSKEGQLAFNLKKGSIPARIDVPSDQFDSITQRTITDFAKNILVPSAAHGSAVMERFVMALNDQLSVFIQEKSIRNAVKNFEFAAKDSGLRK